METSNLRDPKILPAFQRWIDESTDVQGRLAKANIPMSLLYGEATERELSRYGNKLKQMSGLDLGTMILELARRELWRADEDPLKDLTTHQAVMTELSAICKRRGNFGFLNVPLQLHNDRKMLRNWITGKSLVSKVRLKAMLRIIDEERQSPSPTAKVKTPNRKRDRSKRRPGAQEPRQVQKPLARSSTPAPEADKRRTTTDTVSVAVQTKRTVSILSVLKSTENLAHSIIERPELVIPGDQGELIGIVRGLFEAFGITKDRAKELLNPKLEASEALNEVSKAFLSDNRRTR